MFNSNRTTLKCLNPHNQTLLELNSLYTIKLTFQCKKNLLKKDLTKVIIQIAI